MKVAVFAIERVGINRKVGLTHSIMDVFLVFEVFIADLGNIAFLLLADFRGVNDTCLTFSLLFRRHFLYL